MTGVVPAGLAVLGALVGSFLNVVIWRVPRGESVVSPPSHCPSCASAIAPYDNVPIVSWLLLGGRCRRCRRAIGPRYPFVEALTAVLFALLGVRFGPAWQLPAFLYLAAVGVALAAIDLDCQRLPNVLTLPSYPVAFALLLLPAAAQGLWGSLARAVVGMIALAAFYGLLILVYPAGMGLGDFKLSGLLGLYLGWLGYGTLLVGAFLAFLLGGLVGLGVVVGSGAGRRTRVPFGPFMLGGALIAVFAGEAIAAGYLRLTLG